MNQSPLLQETATTLPTVPQPLPIVFILDSLMALFNPSFIFRRKNFFCHRGSSPSTGHNRIKSFNVNFMLC